VVAPVPTPGAEGGGSLATRCRCDEQSSQARGEVICCVIEAGGYFAEVKVSLVGMADHRVEGVDGFVGHGQRNAAEGHVEHGRDDAIAGALRQGFDQRAVDLGFAQGMSIAADNAREPLPRIWQIGGAEDCEALVYQVARGEALALVAPQ
jgi:hypothetical protein